MSEKQVPMRLQGCQVLPPAQSRPAEKAKPAEKQKRTAATSNRFRELNAYVDRTMEDLPRAEALTWLVLWRDTKDGTAKTSMEDIARRIGATKRAVVTAVDNLKKRGLLTLVVKGGINRGPSIYRVRPVAESTG